MKGISLTLLYMLIGVATVLVILVFLLLFIGSYFDVNLMVLKEDFTRKGIFLGEAVLSRSHLLCNYHVNSKEYSTKAMFNYSKLRELSSTISEYDPELQRVLVANFSFNNTILFFTIKDLNTQEVYGPFFLIDKSDEFEKSKEYKCIFEELKKNLNELDTFENTKEILKKCLGVSDSDIESGIGKYILYYNLPCVINKNKGVYSECYLNGLFLSYRNYQNYKVYKIGYRPSPL